MQNEQGELPTVEEAEIAIHKLRCHPSFNIPKHLKKQSKKWLRDNGLNTKIEGLGDGNAS